MNECVTVLLVDDQLDFVNGLSRLLLAEFMDLEVLTPESGKSGIALQEKNGGASAYHRFADAGDERPAA